MGTMYDWMECFSRPGPFAILSWNPRVSQNSLLRQRGCRKFLCAAQGHQKHVGHAEPGARRLRQQWLHHEQALGLWLPPQTDGLDANSNLCMTCFAHMGSMCRDTAQAPTTFSRRSWMPCTWASTWTCTIPSSSWSGRGLQNFRISQL